MKNFILLIAINLLLGFNSFSQSQAFAIKHGPYLQGLTKDEVTIIWQTNRKGIGWIELAPDDGTHFFFEERPRFYSVSLGFKNIDSLHVVKIRNLKPNTRYRYRINSQEVLSYTGYKASYGYTVASDVYGKDPLVFRTLDPGKDSLSFIVINDIHGDNALMNDHLDDTNWNSTDMVFFNGDMVSDIRTPKKLFDDFVDTAVGLFASETPFYFARGNHETRGQLAYDFLRYFPTKNGKTYYTLKNGPVSFLVLDCGEDKPDSNIEYSGMAAFDDFRTEQAKWLEEAVLEEEFTSSKYRIVIIHMPPFRGWHGEKEIYEKFVPVLNKANIDFMLCGHHHKHIFQKADGNINFPVLVNSNLNSIRATAARNQLIIQVITRDGKVTDTFTVKPNKQ